MILKDTVTMESFSWGISFSSKRHNFECCNISRHAHCFHTPNSGNANPQPFLCKALVDAGVSGLAIDKKIASPLGLKKNGVTNNLTVNGTKISPVYFCL
jgi:hypothetical protein